jgi:hypothetical protein
MTGAAVPFVLLAYLIAAALLATGIRNHEWANAMAGSCIIGCLTTAILA